MKFKLALASSIMVIAATGAQAADAIIVQEPVPTFSAPSFTWGGAYVGGQIGYGWGDSELADDFGNGFTLEPRGFLGGLYTGYNFELGSNVVLGVEGDIVYSTLKDEMDISQEVSLESSLRWSGAARVRAGYAIDRLLPYIAGGVAIGKAEVFIDDRLFDMQASQSKTLTGWTIGAGLDYAATDNLILRAEYRYTDFGHKDLDLASPINLRHDFMTSEVRLGASYKF